MSCQVLHHDQRSFLLLTSMHMMIKNPKMCYLNYLKLISILVGMLILSQCGNVYCMEESQDSSSECSSEIVSVPSSAIESSALELEDGENNITFAHPPTMIGAQTIMPKTRMQKIAECTNSNVECMKQNYKPICCCGILCIIVGTGFLLDSLYGYGPLDY